MIEEQTHLKKGLKDYQNKVKNNEKVDINQNGEKKILKNAKTMLKNIESMILLKLNGDHV